MPIPNPTRTCRTLCLAALLTTLGLQTMSCRSSQCARQGRSLVDGLCVSSHTSDFIQCINQLKETSWNLNIGILKRVDGTASAQTAIQSGKAFTTSLSENAKMKIIEGCRESAGLYPETTTDKPEEEVVVVYPRGWEKSRDEYDMGSVQYSYLPIGGAEVQETYGTFPPSVRVGFPIELGDMFFLPWAIGHVKELASACANGQITTNEDSNETTAAVSFAFTCSNTFNETPIDDHMKLVFHIVETELQFFLVTMVKWHESDLNGVEVNIGGLSLTADI